ncbi:hypothetical protein NPIL_331531 [Nephila pilipes]|uniref:Uncharacterized protein n=1 Tax=Nephila pilipes TaxID=299642 RepID=A0A8X6PCW3_NEPPI|nr:hypothetical protein NPIL_331531 [Nephila pilipes]
MGDTKNNIGTRPVGTRAPHRSYDVIILPARNPPPCSHGKYARTQKKNVQHRVCTDMYVSGDTSHYARAIRPTYFRRMVLKRSFKRTERVIRRSWLVVKHASDQASVAAGI